MKLTIKQQIKDKNRFNLYLDDKYWLAVNSYYLALKHLKDGDISPELKQEIESENATDKAGFMALRYLTRRPHSVAEMRIKLKQKSIDPEDIEKTIAKLIEAKLLDDGKFAESFRRDAVLLKSESLNATKLKLIKKGVSKDILDNLDRSQEEESACRLAVKKLRLVRDEQKVLAFLARKGFSYDVAKKAVRISKTITGSDNSNG